MIVFIDEIDALCPKRSELATTPEQARHPYVSNERMNETPRPAGGDTVGTPRHTSPSGPRHGAAVDSPRRRDAEIGRDCGDRRDEPTACDRRSAQAPRYSPRYSPRYPPGVLERKLVEPPKLHLKLLCRRPGRLEREIAIGLPSHAERVATLRAACTKAPRRDLAPEVRDLDAEIDWEALGSATAGFSTADLLACATAVAVENAPKNSPNSPKNSPAGSAGGWVTTASLLAAVAQVCASQLRHVSLPAASRA